MTARRALLRGLGAGALAAAWGPASGQTPKLSRIGVLWFASRPDPAQWRTSFPAQFRQHLSVLGHLEGKTVAIDERFAEGNAQRLSELARELVAAKADVIVASGVAASRAARQATATIPIVMVHAANPIGAGLIASLARPGGNVTGSASLGLGVKQVELMRELVPRAARLGILVNPSNAGAADAVARMTEAAKTFQIGVSVAEVVRGEDFLPAFDRLRNARPDGLLVLVDPLIGDHRAQVIEFAASQRMPAAYDYPNMVRDGGLIAYGLQFAEHWAMAARYVDRILKGAKPADLPVEQPTRFELVVNLRTAKALGLAIPQSVRVRADEVIE